MSVQQHPAPKQTEPLDRTAAYFLGTDAGLGGPFALLGVTHECGGAPELARALQRRLTQLARHPHALTPAADELRLALHAAAAQLADPEVRAECAKVWEPGEPNAMPTAWRRHLSAVSPRLIKKARHIVGVSGGWNARAKKRLAMVARTHRVNAVDLVRALRPQVHAQPRGAEGAVSRGRSIDEPRPSGRVWMQIHAALVAMLLIVSVMIARELLIVRPAWQAMPPVAATPSASDPDQPRPITAPPVREDVHHHAALVQELRNAIDDADRNPAIASGRVVRVIGRFIDAWPDAPTETRERIGALLARHVAAAEEPGVVTPMLEMLIDARTLDDPRADAGAVAISQRLRTALSADEPAYQAFLEAVPPGAAPEGDMDSLLFTALERSARSVIQADREWWAKWGTCVDACTGVPEPRRTQAVLDAMEHLLVQRTGKGWEGIAVELAGRVAWRSGSPARSWLLDRLADPRARTDRLAELTLVLATEVSVPGVDVTVVLEPDAGSDDRKELAAEYRRVWLAERPEMTTAQAEVLDALRAALGDPPLAIPAWDRLRVIERLARANAAAAFLHAGDEDAALDLLTSDANAALGSSSKRPGGPLEADWAVRLLSAETEEDAMRVLGEAGLHPFGHEAAEAAVDAALRGPGRAVRERARSMLANRGDSPAVLLAMERAIGDRPSSATMELVADVLDWASGAPRDLSPDEARRALVLAAAEQVVNSNADGSGDHFGLLIQEHLAFRAGIRLTAPSPLSLSVMVDRWAAGTPADQDAREAIDRTMRAMAEVSGGAGQLQSAYHRALVELIAIGLSGSGDVTRSWAQRVIEQMNDAWSSAPSATDQYLVSHQAEARLWELAMEGTP